MRLTGVFSANVAISANSSKTERAGVSGKCRFELEMGETSVDCVGLLDDCFPFKVGFEFALVMIPPDTLPRALCVATSFGVERGLSSTSSSLTISFPCQIRPRMVGGSDDSGGG